MMKKIDELLENKVFIVKNPNRKKDTDQHNVRVLQLDEVLVLMQLAKKEVFDDIEKECPSPIWDMLNRETIIPLKKRHLSPSAEECKKCGKDYQIYGHDGLCDDCRAIAD